MPKISVIIPCYNVEKCLEECLDSVLKQTFNDFEVICVEDCSTDNTLDILQKYKNKLSIHVVHNDANKGQAESRNIGLKLAKGDYIYFLDSDDIITPNCLEILYNKISKDNSDLVIAQIKAYPQEPTDSFCTTYSDNLNDYLRFTPFEQYKVTPTNAINNYNKLNCCPVNKLYRKSFLLDNNIYFIHQKCFHEDNGFWLKILACNPIISGIDEITYFYRVRNGSTTDKMNTDKKIHKVNLKKSLEDALDYAKKRNNNIFADFIYYEIYRLKKHKFSFIWLRYEKHLKIFWITIFKIKLNPRKGKYTLKILGIPVLKWREKNA